MIEHQTNNKEMKISSSNSQPEFIEHCDLPDKEQKGQIETTQRTSDRSYHKYILKIEVSTGETPKYIGSNQEEMMFNCEGETIKQLDKEDILERRSSVKEISHNGTNSLEETPITNTGWDVVETVSNQDSAISQLKKGITIQEDVLEKGTHCDEDITVSHSRGDKRYETMKSVKLQSNHWEDLYDKCSADRAKEKQSVTNH